MRFYVLLAICIAACSSHANDVTKECSMYQKYVSALGSVSALSDLDNLYKFRGDCELSNQRTDAGILDIDSAISLGNQSAAMTRVEYLLKERDFRQAVVMLGILSEHTNQDYALSASLVYWQLISSSDVMRGFYGEHFGVVAGMARKKLIEISDIGRRDDVLGVPVILAMNASYYLALNKNFGFSDQERKNLRTLGDELQLRAVGKIMGTCRDYVFALLNASNIPYEDANFYQQCL